MLITVRCLGWRWAAVTETNSTRRGGLTTALGLYMGMFFNSSIMLMLPHKLAKHAGADQRTAPSTQVFTSFLP